MGFSFCDTFVASAGILFTKQKGINNMNKELLKGLTEEQIAKIKACKSQEEMLALAKEEGVELSEEQLNAVSGGACSPTSCPKCHSTNIGFYYYGGLKNHECYDCKYEWR